MKKITLWLLLSVVCSACQAEDVIVSFKGKKVKVEQKTKDSLNVSVDGACVSIESLYTNHQLTLRLTGKSDDGRLVLKTAGKARVKLDALTLTSQEGAPLCLKNGKKVEIVAVKGTVNTLTIAACKDTANHKAAAIWGKGKLLFSGKGTLNVIANGDGCRGIKSKKDIMIEDLTLNVTTTGDNLGEKPFGFGGFPSFGNDSIKHGGFPGFGNDSIKHGAFPGFPAAPDSIAEGGFPGFGGKHKYYSAAKGIASKGKVTVNSGILTVRTSTAGAEGIEGKEGVVFNGGSVDVLATDDAINAGATIEFNGAKVIARSTTNDAVDSNPKGGFFMPFGQPASDNDATPAIIIRGGTVYAWSQVGSPEEGIDCDFSPIVVEGGTIFSVGGGMGEMPSVPTNKTAHQPTVLLIGLDVVKDEPITILDSSDRLIDTVTIPFSLRRSASLVSSPHFKVGGTYKVKTKGYEKTFTIKEPFTAVR